MVTLTGVNCNPIGVPPGPVAVPLTVNVAAPGANASKSTAARRPVPVAPVASPARAIVMSIRPGLTCWANVALAPPDRMKLPSCTTRGRMSAGSNVIVRAMVDRREAFATDTGTVYGPPPTRSVGGGDNTICASPNPVDVVGPAPAGGAAGVVGAGGAAAAGGVVGVGVGGGVGTITVPGTGVASGGGATGCPPGGCGA
jgi:hypothetical protein